MADTVQRPPIAESELDRNQAAYEEIQTAMEREHNGRVALMHDGTVVDLYDGSEAAYKVGLSKYGLGNFSLINIGEQPISLGFFTMFVPGREA